MVAGVQRPGAHAAVIPEAVDQTLDRRRLDRPRFPGARGAESRRGVSQPRDPSRLILSAQAAALRQSADGSLGSIARNFPGYTRDQRYYNVGATASWELDCIGGWHRA